MLFFKPRNRRFVASAQFMPCYEPYKRLLKEPHMIVAGATGSGKSVCLRGVVATALTSSCYMMFIDLKQTEFHNYSFMKNCLCYADDVRTAVYALNIAISMINSRNAYSQQHGLRVSNELDVYIVIDDLSNLLFMCPKSQKLLKIIAMNGRSARVHLLLATQNPNRKTLSAELMSNVTARVALRCSPIESRQILGTPDASLLPRYGAALVYTPDFLKPQLMSIPYFSDAELSVAINAWTYPRYI